MKMLKQICIIFLIYLIGVFISKSLELPIPGSIIGMVILLVLLLSGAIKLESIDKVSDFILDNLALFFIPSGVGIITIYSSIQNQIIQIALLCVGTTAIVMSVTALTVKFIRKIVDKKEGNQ